jgi:hypothetical protein
MAPHLKYLRIGLAAALFTGLVAAGLNYLTDPYGLFGTPRIVGFNYLEPASSERTRVVKPYLGGRMDAVTVIGGNSRPEIGLDPESACWSATRQPVFNAGIPGASFRLQTLYAMHAAGQRTVQMLHAIDFLDFVRRTDAASAPPPQAALRSADERRLVVPGLQPDDIDHWSQVAKDHLTSLFSLTALADSAYTVASQRNPNASTRTPAGFNPGNDYLDIIRHEGQHVLFVQKAGEMRKRLSHGFALDPNDGTPASGFTAMKHLIAWSRQQGIELTLFINPYHAEYLAMLNDARLWPLFDEWKRTISVIAAQEGVVVWDFNTVDAYSSEVTPAPGNRRDVLQWFWEPAHYRRELGELMLARMLKESCAPTAGAPFGVKLEPNLIDKHLQQLGKAVKSYRPGTDRPVSAP